MKDLAQFIHKIIESNPKEVDLTSDLHSELIIETVESILEQVSSIKDIETIESQLIEKNDPSLIFILLALKIVRSKLLASEVKKTIHVSVVFAVYKEHNRILKSSEHPHGEDFLLKKVRQLEWLFSDTPQISWELMVVDDGCPEGSGKIAEEIIKENDLGEQVRVLFLEEAIAKGYAPAKQLNSTNESQKGGSIVYGMWDAVRRHGKEDHVVVYTDADLSTHLGQLMLLIDPIQHKNKAVAIGSRREKESVVIKKGARNDRGKLFIYLWKRLIPNLGHVVDTQCGFKAFEARMVSEIIDNLIEKKFAFDIELLLRSELVKKGSVIKVPIAWIDSEAASTTTDLQPYLPMLKAIVKMNRRYFPDEARRNYFADFIAQLDPEAFDILLENIPQAIVSREPAEFADFDGVRVSDLTT
ncbi:hypothetical protein J1N09_11940 [Aureitalea sp. L0-47]|uniref:hypothetical protein n=1 Tax=Aureitalea sp. L0-47 TaxID=2816962 RepID=UPI002237D7D9|nr:hypothetical protein [Aureitalea sp. L0-47]MCW5520556.1 hypothetical protein [Aureitalea sp. L0-47]